MRYKANTTGISEQGVFEPIPSGTYTVKITNKSDKTTQNGDPMVNIELTIQGSGDYAGRKVWDNIVIPQEGSPAIKILGRTKHFLHCIGEPYEGDIEIDSDAWLDKVITIVVGMDTYKGKKKNIVADYFLDETEDIITDDVVGVGDKKEEDVPF